MLYLIISIKKGEKTMKLAYPCRFRLKDELYRINFRDFREIHCESRSYEDALETAEECLNNLLEAMLEEEQRIPSPSQPRADEVLIPVRTDIAEKIFYIS
jgi:predicted RNase H-like HicB family nuclease